MTVKLTETRRKVLTATAEGHVKRDQWGGDVHSTPGLGRGCCGLSAYQNVRRQIDWLIEAGLVQIPQDVAARTFRWKWELTDAGREALSLGPRGTEGSRSDG